MNKNEVESKEENHSKLEEDIKRELRVNELSKETKNNLVSRIIIAICIVVVILPCILLGDYFLFALILLLSLITTHEISKAPQSIEHRYRPIIYLFSYLMIFLLVFLNFFIDLFASIYQYSTDPSIQNFVFNLNTAFKSPYINIGCFVICIGFFLIEAVFDKKFSLKDAFYFITMLFLVSLGLQNMLYLRYLPFNLNPEVEVTPFYKYLLSAMPLFFVFASACLTDVFAYLVGVLFGKHKMCPTISPKKTWEGFAGGIFFGFAIPFITAMLMAHFGYPILEGVLDIEHWWNILILFLVLPFVGTFGDLFFSKVKREFNIKDFGTVLKSHGGILDRFDSIIFCSIVTGLLVFAMSFDWTSII